MTTDLVVCRRGHTRLAGTKCRACDTQLRREARARKFVRIPDVRVGDLSWMNQALCRDYDPELWFIEARKDHAARAKARGVCARCPVQAECFRTAMAYESVEGYRHGIWGGVGPGFRADYALGARVNP